MALTAWIAMPLPSQAALSSSQLEQVALAPRADTQLPLQTPLSDLNERSAPLKDWLGGVPTVWILADYTCETLCGPAISIVSNALADTGLSAGKDFRLIVAGFDPKDTAAQAQAMKGAQLSPRNGLAQHSAFLRAAAPDVSALTDAFGVRSVYDREHDQFAHPAAAFVVTPEGRISRALSALAVDAASLRLALVEAGQGHVGRWSDQIHLLCYGFDPASGTYTLAARRLLIATSSVSAIVLALLIGRLFRREHATK
ncbi:SCO family protein [Bradyrhizobium jicamae]|uniref:SCO family protein n=1 Tax=Bradyrhizobium jicamae TaxID=280332 RepID=A0ABS5FST3_9BRAD|nr:SCO family protein [Bradyrhizobium jicamae]MBR0799842.1 SCO family protein [Bradyrhizobium jicamae]MBR0935799.1 SCO family protein [Bradyrhizobium jicamae]